MAIKVDQGRMTTQDRILKRTLDLFFSGIGLTMTWWIILIAAILARIDTGLNGFFVQLRVGRDGRPFKIIKIRTMKPSMETNSTVTTACDSRITKLGKFFRLTKIDELPQLVNVLLGDMSFVGPRPDVPGYADKLKGEDRIILSVRPGITGPATLFYRNEEELLASQPDPVLYNDTVLFPHKVKLNKQYIENYSIAQDLNYIWRTISGNSLC